VCGTPFFPHLLIHLVGLDVVVRQRVVVGQGGQGGGLELVSQAQQVGAVAAELAGQPGGGLPLGEAAEGQDQLGGPEPDAGQGGAGEGVEDAAAALAAVVQHRGAAAAVDPHLGGPTRGAAQAPGVQVCEQPGVAGVLVHEVSDREVHGGLRGDRSGPP
jgi:hypothetical protein